MLKLATALRGSYVGAGRADIGIISKIAWQLLIVVATVLIVIVCDREL